MLCLIVSMAGFIARQMLYALFGMWQMWQMLFPRGGWLFSCFSGRCYCQWNVADVFTTTVYSTIDWLMLLPSGRWNSHMLLICFQCCMGRCYCPVADGMATSCIFVMANHKYTKCGQNEKHPSTY